MRAPRLTTSGPSAPGGRAFAWRAPDAPAPGRPLRDLVADLLVGRAYGAAPPSGTDPGRTLLGIAARFAELVAERLERVPDRDHLAFLDLLGVGPRRPLPARVALTFTLAEGRASAVSVPAGTQVAAPGDDGADEVVYETASTLVVTPAVLSAVVVDDPVHGRREDVTALASGAAPGFDASRAAAPVRGEPPLPAERALTGGPPALYLGFDRALERRPVTLHVDAEPGPDGASGDPASPLVWEHLAEDGGWRALRVRDATMGLTVSGPVQFVGPGPEAVGTLFGRAGTWLRAYRRPAGPLAAATLRITPNTVWALEGTTVTEEIVGSGTGAAVAPFATARTPVLEGERVEVREPDGTWTRWDGVPDLHGSGPADPHYVLDPFTGRLRFGDGVAGRVPPAGIENVRVTYRTGSGAAGDRPAGAVNELKSAVPYVDAVTNPQPARGGAAAESAQRFRERAPRMLRHGDRAVAADDVADLALDASAQVALARAVPASGYRPDALWSEPGARLAGGHATAKAGTMRVIVVPVSDVPRPAPDPGLLRVVGDHLRRHGPVTAAVRVTGPEWIRVTVTAVVEPADPDDADALPARVTDAVERFLHPVTGGRDGRGWLFGRTPRHSDLLGAMARVPGIAHVVDPEVAYVAHVRNDPEDAFEPRAIGAELDRTLGASPGAELTTEARDWLARSLPYSGAHRIDLRLDGNG